MGIIRVRKDNNYSVINNTGLKDERLSWKAKGILAYALTLPNDWIFHISELSQHAKDGEDSLRSGFKELKDLGYIKRYPVRDEKSKKIKNWETEIYETPYKEIPREKKPHVGIPQVEKPDVEFPQVGNLHVENPTLLNTNILSTNKLNTNIPNTNHHHDKNNNTSSQKLIDEEFKSSYNFMLKNGIALSEIAITELGEFCDTLGSELIMHAVNKAIDENVPKWRYIRSILSNWEKRKVKTLNDVAALDTQFELSKNKKRSSVGYTKRKEMVPEWLRQQENENPEEQIQQNSHSNIDEERKRLEAELKKYKSS
ncbi:DnaD domain protein [Bacillus pseudomycoides]|uniref:DnaD domain protein n=1 Tax=Bacillus bingmayongensis TaxID=1150157 RepID=A0ABU5JV46_9BACI|nr:DnaD domain protein [Bacillus pseudomycoides]